MTRYCSPIKLHSTYTCPGVTSSGHSLLISASLSEAPEEAFGELAKSFSHIQIIIFMRYLYNKKSYPRRDSLPASSCFLPERLQYRTLTIRKSGVPIRLKTLHLKPDKHHPRTLRIPSPQKHIYRFNCQNHTTCDLVS